MVHRYVWFLLALWMLSFVGATSPPRITGQPQSITVPPGMPAVFLVTAEGEELAYEWQRDGNVIAGANQAVFTIDAPTQADDGAKFRVRVFNDKGSVLSCIATLSVVANGSFSQSAPECPPEEAPSDDSGGCGGGGGGNGSGGGGGSNASSTSSSGGSSSGDPGASSGLPDYLKPYPVTKWKGTVKITTVLTTADGSLTKVIDGTGVTFVSDETERGLFPRRLRAIEGHLAYKRTGSLIGCAEEVIAEGTIGPDQGSIDFTPDAEYPQHPTQLKYTGVGQANVAGTRKCGSTTDPTFSEYTTWLLTGDQTTSPDLLIISGTYVVEAPSGSGTSEKTTYEWSFTKQR